MSDALVTIEPRSPDAGIAVLDMIQRAARDASVDVPKMQALLDMYERLSALQAERQFNEAMRRLQPKLPVISKRGRIVIKGSEQPYAKYEDIVAAVQPLMAEEGFSITFGARALPTGTGLEVTAELSHSGGHSRKESMPLPFDTTGSKNQIQAIGSTVTYGKRYLLCAMLNIVAEGEDRDGEDRVSYITGSQKTELTDLITQCHMETEDVCKFLRFLDAKSLDEIPTQVYPAAVNFLRLKLRRMSG